MIELWETFLLQLDAEDEVPGQTVQDLTDGGDHKATPLGGGDAANDDETASPPGIAATPTDVALEQDA